MKNQRNYKWVKGDCMNTNCKDIWEESKDKLPFHQRQATEGFFRSHKSYDICWICGEDEHLSVVDVEDEDGEITRGIMCQDCIEIQKIMGSKIIDVSPIN